MKILIAEDDPDIRMLHQKQLTNWGHNVDLAVNGKRAVECVYKSGEKGAVNYDLCLMDVNMPIMNGIEAIQAIRKNNTYLPVIAYSANMENKAPCLEAGADKFLLKPHPSVELKKVLEEFSVKQMILYLEDENLLMRKLGPTDSKELTELRMLDKKGMTKITIVDTSFHFSDYNNIQKKRVQNVNDSNFRFTETLDYTYQGGNVMQFHASQVWLKKMKLTPKQLRELVIEEDEILKEI
ncbi:MAG: response regulator [Gammaproteobacteria bacterium]|nr:response regulator [Gammaproteobacteria bacterium]MCF6259741.1 response regulator [Gammaproteobacteria bacterium]